MTVVSNVGICPATGELLVQAPALDFSVIVSFGKTLHPHCLLMVIRGPSGTTMQQPCFCH